jgi:hypothetical protein
MNKLVFALLFLNLLGCGPSREEQAKYQRFREDSIKNAVIERFAKIESLKDSVASANILLQKTSNLLVIRKGDLAASRDKLNRIREFQFLRTEVEREQQVRDQTIVIENLEIEIRKLAARIDNSEVAVRSLKAKLSTLQ